MLELNWESYNVGSSGLSFFIERDLRMITKDSDYKKMFKK